MQITRGIAAASIPLALWSAHAFASRTEASRTDIHTAEVQAAARPEVHGTLTVDGEVRSFAGKAADVAGVLQDAGVETSAGDRVVPDLTVPAVEGMSIAVTHAQHTHALVRLSVPCTVQYKRTYHLLPGHRAVAQQGIPGIRAEEVDVARLDGKVVRRTTLRCSWVRKPRTGLVLVGMEASEAARSLEGSRRAINLVATAYDVYLGGAGSGRTATGVHAGRGVVAVDPRVIPLGTHLYVPGYGYCVAADTGGAIKGHRIDLCVNTPVEANRYGVHRVRVYIVD